ncbi:MAG: PD40 domain-containing protein [Acidobacteria bacterium]|nr:PD40 domain-containing protein [Acidobacteriota bacterium]
MSRTFFLTNVLTVAAVLSLSAVSRAQEQPGALVAKFESPDHFVQAVAFSPDGRLLAAGDRGVSIWRVADGAVVARPLALARKPPVMKVAFSPDGKLFAAATDGGDVLLWAVGSWRSHKTLLSNRGKASDLSFSPDGSKLAYSSDTAAILYDINSGKATVIADGDGRRNSFDGVSFSPDGKFVVVCGNGSIRVWDVEGRKMKDVWPTEAPSFFGRLSPDGRHVVSGGGSIFGRKSVEVRAFPAGEKVGELTDFRNGVFAADVSHSGRLFAVAGGTYGGGEGVVSLWELAGARELGFVSFGNYPIRGLAFSPDDSLLAAASDDGFALLYAVERLRGPLLKKQDSPLCGEVLVEGDAAFITSLSKVPNPMRSEFELPWKLEVSNPDAVRGAAGVPVVLRDWAIESSAATDRARVKTFSQLLPREQSSAAGSDYIVFGRTQNPGWDESFIVKIYRDGTFFATNNSGKCLASGRLAQLKTDFETVRKRLLSEGLLSIPKEPLTLGADHFGTAFIEISAGGAAELRSDADDVKVLLEGGPAKKREAFKRVFELEEQFVNALLRAGMRPPVQ